MYYKIVFKGLEKSFFYKFNDSKISPTLGQQALVNFKSKKKIGYIVSKKIEKIGFDKNKVKPILKLMEPKINKNLYQLAIWISDYYICSFGDVLDMIYPSFSKIKRSIRYKKGPNFNSAILKLKMVFEKNSYSEKYLINKLQISKQELEDAVQNEILIKEDKIKTNYLKEKKFIKLNNSKIKVSDLPKNASVQRTILKELLNNQILEYAKISEKRSSIKSLQDKNLIKIITKKIKNKKHNRKNKINYNLNILSQKQKNIYKNIKNKLNNGFSVNYIYGITGSGKTEIYFHLIKDVLKKNKNVIYLVPEVALTDHLIHRLKDAFGDNINLNHSYLKKSKKRNSWLNAHDGVRPISIGPRSTIFLPYHNLGLIIIDEEHESTYKQNNIPRYNGRDAAIMRGKIEKIPVILGSATPSMESLYNIEHGRYKCYRLKERYNNAKLPEINVINMKDINERSSNFYPFSKSLIDNLKINLEKKQQSIIFLNRKGYKTYLKCKTCGQIVYCDDCSTPLTYYKSEDKLKCNICDRKFFINKYTCKNCGKSDFKYFGVGVELLLEKLENIFPDQNIQKIDGTTVRNSSGYEELFNKFKKGEISILVGTQIIAKGLDFNNVTLVGIINADSMMNIPDFRANERSFQLISQVSGRAGRGQKEGRVYLQTYTPDSYVIENALKNNIDSFYKDEIEYRRKLRYPPFFNLIRIILNNKNKKDIKQDSSLLKKDLNIFKQKDIKILGPKENFIFKKNKYYSMVLLIKGKNRKKMNNLTKILKKNILEQVNSQYIIDVDPYQMY